MAQSATPAAKTKNITSDKSPVCPVCQHFLSWGKYETVVQSAATRPTQSRSPFRQREGQSVVPEFGRNLEAANDEPQWQAPAP